MKNSRQVKIGITQGDINGIGYEVILKTFSDAAILELCTPVIYGSSKVIAYHKKTMELPPVNSSIIHNVQDAGRNRVNIINCVDEEVKVELAVPTEESGKAAFRAIERAIQDLNAGLLDALVTLPVSRQAMQLASIAFAGHTEYLEASSGQGNKALTTFISDSLRIALVTAHISLSKVPELLSIELILDKLRIFNRSLKMDFGIRKPRIALLSLNPMGEDNISAGTEEQEMIIPAIEIADKEGILCFGPYAAGSFFGSEKQDQFDGILAMYHDQGIVPFTTLTTESGVHFTAGLPIVHIAPDHGVAYDIAGKNLASESSFRHALYLAIDVYRNRQIDREINANPLRKQYFEKGNDNEKLDLTKE